MSKLFYGTGKYKTLSHTTAKIAQSLRRRRFSCNKRAQNFLEYTVLIAVISAALLAMSQYVQRAMNARLRQVQMELDESKR